MKSNEKSVLCIGHINWDVIIHTDRIPSPDYSSRVKNISSGVGGTATNTAKVLSSLDIDTKIVGSIGDDEFGERIESELDNLGVDSVLFKPGVETTVIHAILPDDTDPLYFGKGDDDIGRYSPDEIPDDVWDNINHVHLTSFSEIMAEEFAQKAKDDGKTVSFNPTQGYKNTSFKTIIELSDIVILNDRELDILKSRNDFDLIIESTDIVVTHGSDGCSYYDSKNKSKYTDEGEEVPKSEVVDVVGAGDAFTGALLNEWLKNTPPHQMISIANSAGAKAVQSVGSIDKLSKDDINFWVDL